MPKQRKEKEICKAIKGRPAKERAKVKAREIVKAVKAKTPKPESLGAASLGGLSATPDMEWSEGGYSIAISDLSEDGEGTVTMTVTASRNGAPVAFSNPLRVTNPPVMAPDGTTYVETDDMGEEMVLMNMKEDPVRALQMVVLDAVRLQ